MTMKRNHLVQAAYHAINHHVMNTEGRMVVKRKVAEMWDGVKRSEKCEAHKDINHVDAVTIFHNHFNFRFFIYSFFNNAGSSTTCSLEIFLLSQN